MRVSVLQENLAKGLSIVGRAVQSRPTLPILANVMIKTEEARLQLSATNLELGITCWIGAKVDTSGEVTIPARTLQELVGTLPPERVDMDLDPRSLTLHLDCAGKTANIKGMEAGEFPLMPDFDTDRALSVPAQAFKEMIDQVVFAAAKEDNRPILTGILARFEGETLTLAAADGYRLAVRTIELELGIGGRSVEPMIIPARTLQELSRIITDEDEEVLIAFPDARGQVMFSLGSVVLISQLIEGKFPDYEAIIPRRYETATLAYTKELLAACRSSEVFAKDSANTARIVVEPSDSNTLPGRVIVAGRSQEKGDAEAPVDASVEGHGVEIAFNIRYLIDVLSVIREEQVVLETSGPTAPGVVRPAGRDDFIHVIMPMSTGR
ncbi:MAG TPA: DNA polymerase III subunit beta [Aggregatilinea sp.]|jgi:DNA polymerase-3 subunit beta|uniref:DNA polymerase III subunit beta n=1 Tax=Aggregatilinea sp. TaxID=2806333 RepID=UPI002CC72646|nr:DNA polymerase III subunit beta [Aggregatilinea sp.]HML21329.1 DNA polymerase III subunit beta [Aggregatilinea sp.]